MQFFSFLALGQIYLVKLGQSFGCEYLLPSSIVLSLLRLALLLLYLGLSVYCRCISLRLFTLFFFGLSIMNHFILYYKGPFV